MHEGRPRGTAAGLPRCIAPPPGAQAPPPARERLYLPRLSRPARPHLELHAAVLLAGLTAVLGELITVGALPLVWWRVLLAAASFVPLYYLWPGRRLRLSAKPTTRLLGVGALVGLHWVTFYGSVKLANASVALVCFALVSPLTALLEPPLLGTRFNAREFALGCLVLPGMLLVAGAIDAAYYAGFAVGIASAVLAALFGTLNKRYVAEVRPVDLSLVEMAGAWATLTLLYPLLARLDLGGGGGGAAAFWPTPLDWAYLLVLALACTTLAYLLATRALRSLSAFTTNLAYALEPVYGIVLAAVLLDQYEELSAAFYLGAALITLAVLTHGLLNRRAGVAYA